jgi:hypothetical protein
MEKITREQKAIMEALAMAHRRATNGPLAVMIIQTSNKRMMTTEAIYQIPTYLVSPLIALVRFVFESHRPPRIHHLPLVRHLLREQIYKTAKLLMIQTYA